jgi:hypothetical protein
MTTKARKKPKASCDRIYKEAWRACREPWINKSYVTGEITTEVDMRAALTKLLRSGWSARALKAYATSHFRERRYKHVTNAPWRFAVHSAYQDVRYGNTFGSNRFLEEFNADPERWAHL